jgi:hypothetical protein
MRTLVVLYTTSQACMPPVQSLYRKKKAAAMMHRSRSLPPARTHQGQEGGSFIYWQPSTVFPRERKRRKGSEGLMCGAVLGWACAGWVRPHKKRVRGAGRVGLALARGLAR